MITIRTHVFPYPPPKKIAEPQEPECTAHGRKRLKWRTWEQYEDHRLIALSPDHTDEQIGGLMNRTEESIKRRRRDLGLKRESAA